jgi:hypothetical protein
MTVLAIASAKNVAVKLRIAALPFHCCMLIETSNPR